MLKRLKTVFTAFVLLNCFGILFADDCTLPDVEDKYIGTYIPVDIEEYIKLTKDFYGALQLGYPKHHDVLYLGKNICYSDAHFDDGYALDADVFKDYHFEETKEGIFCVDKNGLAYRQISNFVNEYGQGYAEYMQYVNQLIKNSDNEMKNYRVSSDKLILDDIEYEIIPNRVHFDCNNVVFWLFSKKTGYRALVKNGLNGELHESYRNENDFCYHPEKESTKVFPLMFLDSYKDFPNIDSIPKEQYRYVRNLIYARHGYIFKSSDLMEAFNQFVWYKPNPDFSDNMLSKKEKDYVSLILKKEAE